MGRGLALTIQHNSPHLRSSSFSSSYRKEREREKRIRPLLLLLLLSPKYSALHSQSPLWYVYLNDVVQLSSCGSVPALALTFYILYKENFSLLTAQLFRFRLLQILSLSVCLSVCPYRHVGYECDARCTLRHPKWTITISYLSFWADFPARRKLGERKDFEKRWELCCAMEEMVRDKA